MIFYGLIWTLYKNEKVSNFNDLELLGLMKKEPEISPDDENVGQINVGKSRV